MTARQEGLAEVIDAAQRVAGAIAARGRDDHTGARLLLGSFESADDLAGGALLVGELALGLLSRATGESLDACVSRLSLELAGLPVRVVAPGEG